MKKQKLKGIPSCPTPAADPLDPCPLKKSCCSFPGGTVDKNLPANAGDAGSIPDPGRSHMPRSSWVQAPHLLSLCSRAQEAHALHLDSSAYSLQLEKAHA